jgi:hypothetical protein
MGTVLIKWRILKGNSKFTGKVFFRNIMIETLNEDMQSAKIRSQSPFKIWIIIIVIIAVIMSLMKRIETQNRKISIKLKPHLESAGTEGLRQLRIFRFHIF